MEKAIAPIVSESSGVMYVSATTKTAPVKSPVSKDSNIIGNKKWVQFGNDDNYPLEMMALGRKSIIIPTAAKKKASAAYGAGLNYGTVDYGDDDKIIRKSLYAERPEIKKWLKKMNEQAYRHMFATEFAWLENCFVQGIISFDRRTIERYVVIPTRKCRLAEADENGLSKSVFISGDFDKEGGEVELPLIDHLYDPVGQIKAIKGNRFMLHFKTHCPDLDHYAIPDWDSARQSRLLPYIEKIILFKESFIENQNKVATIVYIADWYLRWKYKDWDEKAEQQQDRFQEVANTIEEKLSATDKSGVALVAITQELFIKDKSETREPFRIVPVDRPKLTDMLNEDLSKANENLFIAAGIDATLVMSTSNNMGGGSGSNKRVAQNNMGTDAQSPQDMMLTPLNIAIAYNFGDDIECWLMQPYITTLDTGKQTETIAQ
jgi:hypothetical protein